MNQQDTEANSWQFPSKSDRSSHSDFSHIQYLAFVRKLCICICSFIIQYEVFNLVCMLNSYYCDNILEGLYLNATNNQCWAILVTVIILLFQ